MTFTSQSRYYRSVFLSDFHMGAKAFDAGAVVDFLKSVQCEYLFLVGDIIDGWKLKKRWYWTENCNRVIDEIIRKADEGTKIVYLPGNHDEEIRGILPFIRQGIAQSYKIKIKDKIVHTMADGRHFLVMHGDQFDRRILRGRLSKWGDRVYDRFMDFINGYNAPTIEIDGKIKPFSLAKHLSKHGQRALHVLNNFENAIYKMSERRGVHGLICGHTHIPVIKNIRGITYANCGAWLRSGHTALVETYEGKLELLDWPASHEHPALFSPALNTAPIHAKLAPDSSAYRAQTMELMKFIRQIWRVKQSPERSHTPIRPQPASIRLRWPQGENFLHPAEIAHKPA